VRRSLHFEPLYGTSPGETTKFGSNASIATIWRSPSHSQKKNGQVNRSWSTAQPAAAKAVLAEPSLKTLPADAASARLEVVDQAGVANPTFNLPKTRGFESIA
jgi:hypothetical protein